MSTATVKTSSLAALPPPARVSAAAAAGAAASSPSSADRKGSGTTPTVSVAAAADAALEARIAAIVEKRLSAAAAVSALPKTPARPKSSGGGVGILAQLRNNARLSDDDADAPDHVSDVDASDDDTEAAAPAVLAAAADPVAAHAGPRRRDSRARIRIAAQMLRNCAPYGSVTSWVKQNEWKSGRNKHECEAVARAVDALLSEGTPVQSTGIEILMRRLSGVHLADQHSEWQLADSVAWNPLGNSLLPRAEVTRALKEADQLKRLTSNMSNGGYRYKRDAGAGRQRDRRDGDAGAVSKGAWKPKHPPTSKAAQTPAAGGAAAAK